MCQIPKPLSYSVHDYVDFIPKDSFPWGHEEMFTLNQKCCSQMKLDDFLGHGKATLFTQRHTGICGEVTDSWLPRHLILCWKIAVLFPPQFPQSCTLNSRLPRWQRCTDRSSHPHRCCHRSICIHSIRTRHTKPNQTLSYQLFYEVKNVSDLGYLLWRHRRKYNEIQVRPCLRKQGTTDGNS